MNKIKNKHGFTLVELVVVATILTILTSLGFYSYVGNLQDSRDSVRIADIAKLSSGLKLYEQKRGVLPIPGDNIALTNNGTEVVILGKMDNSVSLSTLDKLVFDPKIKTAYTYAITKNRHEFQIAASLEDSDNPKAILNGNYKTVAVNILPNLILATDSGTDLEITLSSSKTLFVFDGGYHNLPYTFDNGNFSYTDGTPLNDLLSDNAIEFWQNSDYRTCLEIYESGKSIGDGEYQILNSAGVLTNTGCTSM